MRREPVLLRDTCNLSALCARLGCLLAIVLLPSTKPKPKHRRVQAQIARRMWPTPRSTSYAYNRHRRLGSSLGWSFMSMFLYANAVVDSTNSKGKGVEVETYVRLLSSAGAPAELAGLEW